MCPVCLATAALIVAGTMSAGGVTAFVVKTLGAKTGTKSAPPPTPTAGDPHGSIENRVTI
jgi:hypothetical protein